MSEPRGSLQLETLLQALLVVGVFAVALVYAIRSNRAVTRAEMEFAQAQGWTYTFAHNDPHGLTKRLKALQQVLLEHKKLPGSTEVWIDIGPGGAVVLKWGGASPAQWTELLDLCRRIEAEVP